MYNCSFIKDHLPEKLIIFDTCNKFYLEHQSLTTVGTIKYVRQRETAGTHVVYCAQHPKAGRNTQHTQFEHELIFVDFKPIFASVYLDPHFLLQKQKSRL